MTSEKWYSDWSVTGRSPAIDGRSDQCQIDLQQATAPAPATCRHSLRQLAAGESHRRSAAAGTHHISRLSVSLVVLDMDKVFIYTKLSSTIFTVHSPSRSKCELFTTNPLLCVKSMIIIRGRSGEILIWKQLDHVTLDPRATR